MKSPIKTVALNPEWPLSIVLGGGSIRGLAHVAILRVLLDAGFAIKEIVGTSVGALIVAFYAAIGMDLDAMADAGLSLKSSHLLSWSLLRHAPTATRNRWAHFAGVIPGHLQRLASGSFDRMHHGIDRIGIVTYDLVTKAQVVCNNVEPILRLEDAVRGAVALPHLFPPWRCTFNGRDFRLIDGGVTNRLPLDVLFQYPFRPVQVLALDISARPIDRQTNIERVNVLKREFPNVPIDVMFLDTLGGATVMYRSGYALKLLESAQLAARQYVSCLPLQENIIRSASEK